MRAASVLGCSLALLACGRDLALQRIALQSQDYVKQHILSERICSLPEREWDDRGEGVVAGFRSLHAAYADGSSLDPEQLYRVQILRYVSSEEMRELKGGDVSLSDVPLGMVRARSCDRKPFGGTLRWTEMYFLDPELGGHDPENAAIMRSPENLQTVYVHEALHALGYQHFAGDDSSLSLRDGAAGSRFVPTALRGRAYRDELGQSFREDYLKLVPRHF